MHPSRRLAATAALALTSAGTALAEPTDPLEAHVTVLGVTLEQSTLEEARALLGAAEIRHNGLDACEGARSACYAGPDGTVLLLSSHEEMGGGTIITSFQLVERRRLIDDEEADQPGASVPSLPTCATLHRLARATATAGGLRLGMSREEVLRLLGPPEKARPERLDFMSMATLPMTPQQQEAFSQATSGRLKDDRMTRLRTVSVELAEGRVTAIRVYQVTAW